MEVTIQKWGNSLALRIPINYAKEIHLRKGSHVNLFKKNNKIIIISQEKDLNLEDLLSQITPENLHNENFFGDPVGKEIW